MPYPSPYPPIDIPVVDLWKFLFENEKREFPDDKGKQAGFTAPPRKALPSLTASSYLPGCRHPAVIHLCRNKVHSYHIRNRSQGFVRLEEG